MAAPDGGQSGGLIRGLQLELGFTSTDVDGVFGNSLKDAVPDLTPPTSEEQTIISTAQSALRVKGYNALSVGTGEFGHFTDLTVTALQTMCDDANYSENRALNGNIMITDEIWKGLCSQGAYVAVAGGDVNLRTIQRRLNSSTYQPTMGLNPTDVIVTPQLARGRIKALQVLLGFVNTDDPTVDRAADVAWGPTTAQAVRDEGPINAPSQQWTRQLAYAVYLNGSNIDVEDPRWREVAQRANGFGYALRLDISLDNNSAVSPLVVAALFVS